MTEAVIDFYTYCNGFDAHLEDSYDGNLFSLDDHLYYLREMNSEEFPLFNTLFPIREDGAGNFDCVVLMEGLGNNSVVFNEAALGQAAYLKASSLTTFISFLTEDLILRFQPNGEIKPEFHIDNPDPIDTDWPFNAKQMILKDPDLIPLYKDKAYSLIFNEPEELIRYLD